MVVTERWYLVKDRSRAVREGDPAAAFLLVNVGDFIGDSLAAKYGMLEDAPVAVPEVKAIEAPPENKAVSYPPHTKRATEPQRPRLLKRAKRK